MTADVIPLRTAPAQQGSGSCEALQQYFDKHRTITVHNHTELNDVDHLIAWLYVAGFTVVPLQPDGPGGRAA